MEVEKGREDMERLEESLNCDAVLPPPMLPMLFNESKLFKELKEFKEFVLFKLFQLFKLFELLMLEVGEVAVAVAVAVVVKGVLVAFPDMRRDCKFDGGGEVNGFVGGFGDVVVCAAKLSLPIPNACANT